MSNTEISFVMKKGKHGYHVYAYNTVLLGSAKRNSANIYVFYFSPRLAKGIYITREMLYDIARGLDTLNKEVSTVYVY